MAASSSPTPQQDRRYSELNRRQRAAGGWMLAFGVIATITILALIVLMVMSLTGSFTDGYIAPPV